MRRGAVAAGALAAAALAAGCGGGSPSPAPQPPAPPEALGSGYFVGTGPDGVGATVDLRAADATVRALEAALRQGAPPGEPPPAVGIASVVNDSRRAAPAPRFIAVLDSGELLPLRPAADALGTRTDPLARRAARLMPAPRSVLPGGASAVEYVVLRGVVPGRVAEVRMTTGTGTPARLAPRPR